MGDDLEQNADDYLHGYDVDAFSIVNFDGKKKCANGVCMS